MYGQVCKTCHEAGLAGAPKMGDKAAWAPRIAQGADTLYKHAIAGFTGKTGVMPPRGGNPDLTDDEVERAVVYMANKAGAHWKEPAAPANAVAAAAPVTGTAAPAPVAVRPRPPPSLQRPRRQQACRRRARRQAPTARRSTTATCHVCHGAGIAGAPKFGDKAAWAPRIAEGCRRCTSTR